MSEHESGEVDDDGPWGREPPTWDVLLDPERLAAALGWDLLPSAITSNPPRACYDLGDGSSGVIVWSDDDPTPCRVHTERGGVCEGDLLRLDGGWITQWVTVSNGIEHGTSWQFQWGRVIGRYTLEHGTGLDLWYEARGVLSEEHPMREGTHHGPIRWWCDARRVWSEEWTHEGRRHGVWREWVIEEPMTLQSGFPSFWVSGEEVTRGAYERACDHDPTLRPYDPEEDAPERDLPAFEPLDGAPTQHDVILAISRLDALPE